MKSRKHLCLVLALLAAFVLALAACNRNGDGDSGDRGPQGGGPPMVVPTPPVIVPPGEDEEILVGGGALASLRELEAQFPLVGYNVGQHNPILPRGAAGNTFRRGSGAASPFPGQFNPHLSMDTSDSDIHGLFIGPILSRNDSLQFTQNGIAGWEVELDYENDERHRFTFFLQEDVFWHDGTPLTLLDLYYAIWFISHPRTQSGRFGAANATSFIIGIQEWRDYLAANPNLDNFFVPGEVTPLPNVYLSDNNRRLDIYLTNLPPGLLFGGIVSTPLPWHHFQHIPIYATAEHQNSRDNMLGFGPFIIQTVVPGERVLLRANDNYWQGAPLIDYIDHFIFAPELAPTFMQAGHLDVGGFPLQEWEYYHDSNNIQILGRINNTNRFYFFNLGVTRNYGDGIEFVARTDNHPITDVRLRRAVGYAIDGHTLNMTIHNGFRRCATSPLHPFNTGPWINPDSFGTALYDPDQARRILDEAGFRIDPATGFRTDLNGEPFHINFAWAGGLDWIYASFFHIQQNLIDVGLDVRLYNDYFITHAALVNNYMLALDVDYNPDMHMFEMGFTLGWNPSPFGTWGHNQQLNVAGFTNETFQSIISDITSLQAWDADFLADAYRRWEEAFMRYLPAIPQTWNMGLTYVNLRVANWTLDRSTGEPQSGGWHLVGLTAPTTYVHQ